MKLPRNLSGADLVKALGKLGYAVTRQKSPHIRLTTQRNGEHHVMGHHLGLERDELLQEMFG